MLAKSLLLILATHCLLSVARSGKPAEEEALEKCRIKHNMTKEEIKRLHELDNLDNESQNAKCLAKCFYNEMHLMNEKGEFTLDDPSNKDRHGKEYLEACSNVTGSDPCAKAASFANCLQKRFKMEGKKTEA